MAWRLGRLPTGLTVESRIQASPRLCQRNCIRALGTLRSTGPTSQSQKKRLDEVCFELYPDEAQNAIRSWIAQGKVLVNNRVVDKAGAQVRPDAAVQLTAKREKFVCRAGYKLEAALDHFGVEVAGKRALDSGISTGGFTDCLLQRGAAHVVGVDVGYGQVAERVRQDSRVTILERTNVRHLRLSELPEGAPVELATLDLSFISVLKVVPSLRGLMTPHADLLVLVKPQFEAAREEIEAGGVVLDPAVHAKVLQQVVQGVEGSGFACQGHMPSPIRGAASGNKEFLAHFVRLSP